MSGLYNNQTDNELFQGLSLLTETENGLEGDLPTFRPLSFSSSNIAGFAISSMFIMIAAGGGIGGGGILVPVNIFILGFKPHAAIPLSNATILGSSVGQLLLNYGKRHPLADRPLINWDIMLVMEPLTIAGAVVGSVVNVLCPPWLLCVMLVLLLGGTSLKTLWKGTKMYEEESQALTYTPLVAEKRGLLHGSYTSINVANYSSANQEYKEVVEQERHHSLGKLMVMIFTVFGTLVFTIAKGGNDVNYFHVRCGSLIYWILTFAVVPFTFAIAFCARRYLVDRYYLKKRVSFEYVKGDVEWNERHTVIYPAICSIAGLCAGLFGIGGGIVKGPLMLEMSVLPQVASATSATMILFTSSAATVSYLLFNSLNLQFACILFPIGFVSTLIGKTSLDALVKYYGRSSYIVICIAVVIGLSTVAMGVESYKGLIDAILGIPEPVKSFCH